MGFNYGEKRREMEQEFSRIAKVCRADGMSEDDIGEIYELLKEELNSDRRYYTHTRPHDYSDDFSGDEDTVSKQSRLMRKFINRFSNTQGEISEWERHSWIEDMDDPKITLWLKSQSKQNIEFLTLKVVNDMTQTQIANLWGCSNPAVSRRRRRIRESLENFLQKS